MPLETLKQYYTPEEYLALEEQAEERHEYRDGEIVAMPGGTTDHNTIAGNFYTSLRFALKGKKYNIYIVDVKVSIPRYRIYTYPDIMVIEGQPIYEDKSKTLVTNPLLITEVLSKSTKNYDLGDKFIYYRSILEFKEYILIEQSEYRVIQYSKTAEGKWLLSEYESEEAILGLTSIKLDIPIKDLYEGIDFNESDSTEEVQAANE